MCKKCHRFYKTKDLKPEDHRFEQLKCGNCEEFVNKDHHCYTYWKKNIKQHGEKYVYFDFETTLDQKSNEHI